MLREIKVGLLVVAAFVVLGVGVFLVSERKNLFALKNTYFVRFETVAGLATGNPVQLSGVTVGSVESIVLPERVDEQLLTVWIGVDRRFSERVREDSVARIKTMGLLGDKFVEITSGSPQSAMIRSGGEIVAAPATDVDKLIASGGDAVENVVAISYSLRNILARMEAGEGILGELTIDTEAARRGKEALLATVEALSEVSGKLARGEGTLGALIHDDDLASSLEASAVSLGNLLDDLQNGAGPLPALLHDQQTRERLQEMVTKLNGAATDLAELAAGARTGGGLLARLLSDEELGREVSSDLERLIDNLALVSDKLAQGEGTVGRLIDDPQVYEAINDIIVGIDESRFLRWLVRNRQKEGIEKRYETEQEKLEESGP